MDEGETVDLVISKWTTNSYLFTMVIEYLFKEDVKQHWIKDVILQLFLSEQLLAICLKKM